MIEHAHRESDWTNPRVECPHPERWTAPDIEATEREVSEGIGALVRMLQPDYVIETGTYHGHTAEYIAAALRRNGHGILDTIEPDAECVRIASKRLTPGNVGRVTIHETAALDFTPTQPIDFAFFDSAPESRLREFDHFAPWMHERTIVCYHDTGIHHVIIKRHVLELASRELLIPIFLPTPRGLGICQVTHRGNQCSRA